MEEPEDSTEESDSDEESESESESEVEEQEEPPKSKKVLQTAKATVPMLRQAAKKLKIRGLSKMNKQKLEEALGKVSPVTLAVELNKVASEPGPMIGKKPPTPVTPAPPATPVPAPPASEYPVAPVSSEEEKIADMFSKLSLKQIKLMSKNAGLKLSKYSKDHGKSRPKGRPELMEELKQYSLNKKQ